MIDFSSGQLTWIVIGACSLGGTGYMTMNTAMADLDKKVEVITVKAQSTNEKLTAMQQQLVRIEEKLDARSSRK